MKITPEQADFLGKQSITLGFPCYGGTLQALTFMSLLPFFTSAAQIGTKTNVALLTNCSSIDKGRNIITADFLSHEESTHLLWVDSDMTFDPDCIWRLILADRDIVGALCPSKRLPSFYCAHVMPEAIGSNGWNTRDGLVPCARLGTGFMLIKRQVIEKMIAAYPDRKFTDSQSSPERNKHMYALWMSGAGERGTWDSEDYRFCDLWRRIGGEVWADPNMVVNHIGQFTYSADRQQLLASLGATPDGGLNLAPQITVSR